MYIQKRNTSNQNNGIKILCTLHITIICTCMACPSGYSAQECSEPHFRTKICPAPPTHTKSLGGSCPAVCKCKPHELSKVTVFLDPARQNPILVSPRVFNPTCRRFLWARAAANKNSRIVRRGREKDAKVVRLCRSLLIPFLFVVVAKVTPNTFRSLT
jgi:hypothetical protein